MAQQSKRSRNNKKIHQKRSLQQVELSESVIVGAFSVSQDGKLKNDMSALKYIKRMYWDTPKDVNLNLKEIYKNTTNKGRPTSSHSYLDRLNNLTSFIQNNPENFIKNKKVDADFVCFRGALRYVLASFYCFQGWTIEAVKLKGTIYLALITECFIEPIDCLTVFESCIVTSDPNEESVAKVESTTEFCTVMSKKINELKILFGAECDAVISEDPVRSLDDLNNSKLIEIKSRSCKPKHYKKYFRNYKKLHWFCQSFIASIDTIYLGMRNSNDIVKTIETIDVKSLKNPKYSNKFWNKNDCFHRLREFLRNVKKDMEDVNDPNTVFRYEWKEGFTSIWKNQFPMFRDILKDQEFLTDDYISFINNLKEPLSQYSMSIR